ncbi:unnamed protein product [Cuscuta epithymum]|uniref:FHA domain-containing protein n=1 Tax=Cuscuta epithymum TaxID=186058 RepID=A0AAV0C0M7_9ASTE|nr:unnamed protein product [Cuscuta epithymum]
MEIESGDGSKTLLKPGSITHFGRGAGFNYNDDRSVSRRHISFHPYPSPDDERDGPPDRFEVVGKNPVWVHNGKSGGVKTYRRSEIGELESGDMFCVSAKNPIWFTLKRTYSEAQGSKGKKRDTLVGTDPDYEQQGVEELDPDSINLSDIDPVKEFGLVVIGHEFDAYPKKMIKDIKNWDWDIEEPGDESENDEGGRKRWKRKRSCKNDEDGDDDDEWRGESEEEEEKEAVNKSSKSQVAKFMTTRSKDYGKPSKGSGKEKLLAQTESIGDEDSDDEDSDETLGGFIVVDEEIGEDDTADDDDEEEEFDDLEED